MKLKSNRTKIKIDFYIARIGKFLRATSRIMCKLMQNIFFFFFIIIIFFMIRAFFFFEPMGPWCFLIALRFDLIFLALVPARKRFLDENKLTFTKPLHESLNNQSYGRDSGKSLKIGFHIHGTKLNRKYKTF